MARVFSEKAWHSTKVSNIQPKEWRPEYAWLVAIAFVDGTFEADPQDIWARAYAYARPDWNAEQVAKLLGEFERVGLLQRKKDADGRVWGYWTGSDKFTPPPSRKSHFKSGKIDLFSSVQPLASPRVANAQPSASPGLPYVQSELVSDFDFVPVLVPERELVSEQETDPEKAVSQTPARSLNESLEGKSKSTATPLTTEQAERLKRADELRAKKEANAAWWDKFRMNEETNLPDSMRYALPEYEDYDELRAQITALGEESFCQAVNEWERMQSPPIEALRHHRWRVWLKTCAVKVAEVSQ